MAKTKVIIIGAGGHAKVIVDILMSQQAYDLVGCIDKQTGHSAIMGLATIGDDSALPHILSTGVRHAFVAMGDNARRTELSSLVLQTGFSLINAISPHAVISRSVKLGQGVAVMPGAIINADTVIGDNAIINTGATVDHDCSIGAGSHIAPGCSLAGNVVVGMGAFLGVGCKVVPGITIGDWSRVGAGSVVMRDILSYATAYGVPAKVVS